MVRSMRGLRGSAFALLALLLAGVALAPRARAQSAEEVKAERLREEGDALLKGANYFPASEKYSAAVLADPACGWKKIAFGHALFALGHYAYASFNFRRGLRYMGYPDDLDFDLTALFPSEAEVDKALKDLSRYLSHYPGDYHALTVLAHVSFFSDDDNKARAACVELLKQNRRDPFAKYVIGRIDNRPIDVTAAPRRPATPPSALTGLDADLPEGLSTDVVVPLSREQPDPAVVRN